MVDSFSMQYVGATAFLLLNDDIPISILLFISSSFMNMQVASSVEELINEDLGLKNEYYY